MAVPDRDARGNGQVRSDLKQRYDGKPADIRGDVRSALSVQPVRFTKGEIG